MKIGIVGVGYVGTACVKAMLMRRMCEQIVLIDVRARDQHTRGVRNDLSHGGSLYSPTKLVVGDYNMIHDAPVVVITAGVNEKAGQAIDRKDPWGRQRLLPRNAEIYRNVVPSIVQVAPAATIIVATDPPDSLADIAREIVLETGGRNVVLSTGTYLDSRRFREQIASLLDIDSESIRANVLGEHGKTQVYSWASAQSGGVPIAHLFESNGHTDEASYRGLVQGRVLDANIDIIEATDASQHGIGLVTTRIVEAILWNERIVEPVGLWHEQYGVTLSLPSVIGRHIRALPRPVPSSDLEVAEEAAIRRSAAYVAEALHRVRTGLGFDAPPSLTWEAWSRQLQSRHRSKPA